MSRNSSAPGRRFSLFAADGRRWTRVGIVVEDEKTEKKRTCKINDINEQWWSGDAAPEPLPDDNNRFVAFLFRLSRLRAEGFAGRVSGGAANFGLDRPSITAIVYSSPEQPLFTLSPGGEEEGAGRRFAHLDAHGTDDSIFLVPPDIPDAPRRKYK